MKRIVIMANKYINGNGELGHTTFEVMTSCDTSDNVCRDLQIVLICFYWYRCHVFDVTVSSLTLSISLEEVNKKNVKITENVIVCGTEIGFKTEKKITRT